MGPFDPFLKNPPDYCPIGAQPSGCLPNPPPDYARKNTEVINAAMALINAACDCHCSIA